MRICVIAEGLSEMQFLQSIVIPYVHQRNPRVDAMWSVNSQGVGITESMGYNWIKRTIIAKMCSDNTAIYTTMYDYYRFPKINIPGFTYQDHLNIYEKVEAREKAIHDAILSEQKLLSFCDNIVFKPFLMLHEYETLMFCDLSRLYHVRNGNEAAIRKLMKEVEHIENIELINDSPLSAPSKRIAKVINGYQKPSMGLNITKSIGIEQMLEKCRHFREWIDWLCDL